MEKITEQFSSKLLSSSKSQTQKYQANHNEAQMREIANLNLWRAYDDAGEKPEQWETSEKQAKGTENLSVGPEQISMFLKEQIQPLFQL